MSSADSAGADKWCNFDAMRRTGIEPTLMCKSDACTSFIFSSSR